MEEDRVEEQIEPRRARPVVPQTATQAATVAGFSEKAIEFLRQGGDSFMTTTADAVMNWGRKYSMFLYPFVTACCGMEFMSVAGPRYDLDRFGCALPRFSPRQSDLLMVVGTITHRQAPIASQRNSSGISKLSVTSLPWLPPTTS